MVTSGKEVHREEELPPGSGAGATGSFQEIQPRGCQGLSSAITVVEVSFKGHLYILFHMFFLQVS